MIITRTSVISGVTRSMDIQVEEEQLRRWADGELIQLAMPNLSDDDREFIKSGIVPDEWNEHFGG